jgi:hypothetical protein
MEEVRYAMRESDKGNQDCIAALRQYFACG